MIRKEGQKDIDFFLEWQKDISMIKKKKMQFLHLKKKNPIYGASLLLVVSQLAPLCFSFSKWQREYDEWSM